MRVVLRAIRRRFLSGLCMLTAAAMTTATAPALAAGGGGLGGAGGTDGGRSLPLVRALSAGMRDAGVHSSAEVVDLSTGQTLYRHDAAVPRIPASVEKLYTTATVLERYGPSARLTTSLLGAGHRRGATWDGALYLRGGGDPTFGSVGFDREAYDTGASVQALVASLRAAGITAVTGPIIADASRFDADEGTPATGNRPSIYVEGALSALAFNRDWADSDGEVYYAHPALEAGDALLAALRAGGVRVPRHEPVQTGLTPAGATPLADVPSPTMATLVALTNTPSDNFFAEMLLKNLGASFGGAGTTAAGVAVVRSELSSQFGLTPHLIDGSGLSYADHTSPAQVISLLTQLQDDVPFRESLAIVGETGTLVDENQHTYAQGRCTGKTGTLSDVSNVVGYCRSRDGHTLAYAFLMNGVDPDAAHPVQDRMELAVADYNG